MANENEQRLLAQLNKLRNNYVKSHGCEPGIFLISDLFKHFTDIKSFEFIPIRFVDSRLIPNKNYIYAMQKVEFDPYEKFEIINKDFDFQKYYPAY